MAKSRRFRNNLLARQSPHGNYERHMNWLRDLGAAAKIADQSRNVEQPGRTSPTRISQTPGHGQPAGDLSAASPPVRIQMATVCVLIPSAAATSVTSL
jgi:hypothetical protein